MNGGQAHTAHLGRWSGVAVCWREIRWVTTGNRQVETTESLVLMATCKCYILAQDGYGGISSCGISSLIVMLAVESLLGRSNAMYRHYYVLHHYV
jgi:hypothetical protein